MKVEAGREFAVCASRGLRELPEAWPPCQEAGHRVKERSLEPLPTRNYGFSMLQLFLQVMVEPFFAARVPMPRRHQKRQARATAVSLLTEGLSRHRNSEQQQFGSSKRCSSKNRDVVHFCSYS